MCRKTDSHSFPQVWSQGQKLAVCRDFANAAELKLIVAATQRARYTEFWSETSPDCGGPSHQNSVYLCGEPLPGWSPRRRPPPCLRKQGLWSARASSGIDGRNSLNGIGDFARKKYLGMQGTARREMMTEKRQKNDS